MIYHVYSSYRPKNPDTVRRLAVAKRTWQTQPWIDVPIDESKGPLFMDRAGKVPFIKDVINQAIGTKDNRHIIVFTNADICVVSNCCLQIVAALQSIDAGYCFRRDFGRIDAPLPDERIRLGTHYVGSDLYAFRIGWWRKWQHEFPNMLLGRECWDAIMRLLIDQTHPDRNCTLYDLIYHERHGSVWENPANRRSIPSQIHNINLARRWMVNFGYNPRAIGI